MYIYIYIYIYIRKINRSKETKIAEGSGKI